MKQALFSAMLVLLAAAGCGARADSLRARFARDTDCAAGDVHVTANGGNAYVASGCGRSITYECRGAGDDACSEAGNPPGSAAPPPMRTNVPGTDPSLPMPQ